MWKLKGGKKEWQAAMAPFGLGLGMVAITSVQIQPNMEGSLMRKFEE